MKEIYTCPWGNPSCKPDCCDRPSSFVKYIPVARGTSVTLTFNLKQYPFTYDDIKQLTFTLKRDRDLVYYNLFKDNQLQPSFSYNQEKNAIEFTLTKEETVNYAENDIIEVEAVCELLNGQTYLNKQPKLKIISSTYGDLLDVWNGEGISGHLRGNYWYEGQATDSESITEDLANRKLKEYPLSGDLYLSTAKDTAGKIFKLGIDGIWKEVLTVKGKDGLDGDKIIGAGFDENGQMYLNIQSGIGEGSDNSTEILSDDVVKKNKNF